MASDCLNVFYSKEYDSYATATKGLKERKLNKFLQQLELQLVIAAATNYLYDVNMDAKSWVTNYEQAIISALKNA